MGRNLHANGRMPCGPARAAGRSVSSGSVKGKKNRPEAASACTRADGQTGANSSFRALRAASDEKGVVWFTECSARRLGHVSGTYRAVLLYAPRPRPCCTQGAGCS